MIRLNCPTCGRECEFADFLGGLTAVCKSCGHGIPVPRPGQDVPPAASAIAAAPRATPRPPPTADAIQSASGVTPTPAAPAAPREPPAARSIVNDPSDSQPPPDWAVEQVRASLRLGLSVPEIEQRLVAQGLTAAAAAAVVSGVLEEGLRDRFEPIEEEDRSLRVHRALSGLIAGACLLLAYWFGGSMSAGKTLFFGILPPLGCIWFSGAMTGDADSTRAAFLRGCGWLLLLAILGFRIVLLLSISS